MTTELSTTGYALLGLLVFDARTSDEGMTGYELKQRADRTLRFYWVSPAMSQIYTELDRLDGLGLVEASETHEGRRRSRHFRITAAGREQLHTWLQTPANDLFPVLKHPVALRLLMGALTDPDTVDAWLTSYLEQLEQQRADLEAVREMLGDRHEVRYPARVAEWGLAYYTSEREIVEKLRTDIASELD